MCPSCKGTLKTMIRTHHVNQVTRVDDTLTETDGQSYKRSNRPEEDTFGIPDQPRQQFQGFRVLGKRTFAAATSLIAIVALMNLNNNSVEPDPQFENWSTGLEGGKENVLDQNHLDLFN